jgi:hypothetical protein
MHMSSRWCTTVERYLAFLIVELRDPELRALNSDKACPG